MSGIVYCIEKAFVPSLNMCTVSTRPLRIASCSFRKMVLYIPTRYGERLAGVCRDVRKGTHGYSRVQERGPTDSHSLDKRDERICMAAIKEGAVNGFRGSNKKGRLPIDTYTRKNLSQISTSAREGDSWIFMVSEKMVNGVQWSYKREVR